MIISLVAVPRSGIGRLPEPPGLRSRDSSHGGRLGGISLFDTSFVLLGMYAYGFSPFRVLLSILPEFGHVTSLDGPASWNFLLCSLPSMRRSESYSV